MTSNILIVEEEFLIALEMEEVVRDLGHHPVGIADDMASAMAYTSERIDLALVDVNLADGATGPLIGARLAKEFGVKVVFVTANPAQLGDGVEGTIGAVEKPVDLSVVENVVEFILAKDRGQAEVQPPAKLKLFSRA